MPWNEPLVIIDPEISWATTQARLVIDKYIPRIPPILEFFEKSSIKISNDATIKFSEMKYKIKAGMTIEFLFPNARITSEQKSIRLKRKITERLPIFVKTWGIPSSPKIVVIEAMT